MLDHVFNQKRHFLLGEVRLAPSVVFLHIHRRSRREAGGGEGVMRFCAWKARACGKGRGGGRGRTLSSVIPAKATECDALCRKSFSVDAD
jgi:hypothetical protein